MNKHASNVWKAWADDRTVQVHSSLVAPWVRQCAEKSTISYDEYGGQWLDYDPTTLDKSRQPHFNPNGWRIKPDTKTFSLQFKVAIFNDSGWPMCKVVDSGLYEHFEKREDFVCWACEQQSVDITL